MTSELDTLLAALKMQSPDAPLDKLEPKVRSRIAALSRRPASVDTWGWRIALAASMAAIGVVAAGSIADRTSPETSPFAIQTELAPSTLLGGRS